MLYADHACSYLNRIVSVDPGNHVGTYFGAWWLVPPVLTSVVTQLTNLRLLMLH